MLGLTGEELVLLTALAIGLVVLLVVSRAVFRLTRLIFRLGCIGAMVVVVVVFLLMRGLAA